MKITGDLRQNTRLRKRGNKINEAMTNDQLLKLRESMRNNTYMHFYKKYELIKEIIIKRKSAFGCYEWLKLKEILNIDES
jgi:hypothetical protein